MISGSTHGRAKDCPGGVLRPNNDCLLQAVDAAPDVMLSADEDLQALAERLWSLQQSWKVRARRTA